MIYVAFATKAMIWKTLSSKIYGYYFDTLYGGVRWKFFSNYRMGKILFTQNSFENTCVVMEYRDVGVGMEKWKMVMFMKNAQCVLVLTSTIRYPVRPHPPHMGRGLVL